MPLACTPAHSSWLPVEVNDNTAKARIFQAGHRLRSKTEMIFGPRRWEYMHILLR
jgi:hypothetical protein